MPNKASAKKASKADFVRAQPSTMSAREVVAKAAAAKMKLDERYVYRIRGMARKRAGAAAKAPGSRAKLVTRVRGRDPHTQAMRRLILDLGIARARALMDSVVRDLLG